MTNDYLANNCQLSVNTGNGFNYQAYRKGIIGEAFIMYLLYFASQLYQSILTHKSAGLSETQAKAQMPWHQKKWGKQFAILYSHHCVAIGFVILFNPMVSGLVLAYVHLALFGGFIAASLLFKTRIAGILLTLMTFSNLGLILIGIIGINYSNYTSSSGTDCQYR